VCVVVAMSLIETLVVQRAGWESQLCFHQQGSAIFALPRRIDDVGYRG
jgi:hypothetical protein